MQAPFTARMVKAGAMALKAVIPGMPKTVKDRELLEEDLQRIGCHGFLGKPWGLRMEDLVAELLGGKDNRWDGTVRQAPEKWTMKEWRKVYSFGRGGEGMASRTYRFIDGMLFGRVNPKDGYAVADCKDPRVKRVLEFLVPLLYPEKPTRVTITIGNMIFGALSGERLVDWAIVVKDLVQRLLSGMGKSKATPICPYVFHLYHSHELLLPAEKKEYWIQEALVKHNVESEEDEDPASPTNPDKEESTNDSECESLTPSEIREIQKQKAARLKKSPINRRKQPPAPKDPVSSERKSPTPMDAVERNYQTIAVTCREIRARERDREALIQEVCHRLGNVRPDELLEAIEHLPSQKRMKELEAKISFLQEKSKKASEELKEEKELHRKAVDKLNLSLAFNQKLETYVGNIGDVVNKAQLFDANLSQHPVIAMKVIPVLVDFADKMEELLDEMRVLFDGLLSEVPPLAAENLSDISCEIPSLTGWGKDAATETPTKPDQPGLSEPRQEEVALVRPEPPHAPKTRLASDSVPIREVLVESIVGKVIRELEEEEGASLNALTPTQPARINVVQTGLEEQMAERMRELPTPPSGPTPKPISLATPMSLVRSSFLKQLETIVKTPFKTPGQGPSFRLPVSSSTPTSVGTDTQETPKVSSSIKSADKGTETTSLAPRVTQSATKQTPGSSPRPKRAYVSPSKGSNSKRRR